MKRFFLPVCVQNYDHWDTLNGVIPDVIELSNVLYKDYSYIPLSEKYIGGRIMESDFWDILDLLGTTPPDSQLILYYSGHGHCIGPGQFSYWIPTDGAKEDSGVRTGWVDSMIFIHKLKEITSRHVLLINNTCLSGQLIQNCCGMPSPISANQSKTREIISACDEEELVYEPINGNVSPFIFHLANLLRENEGFLESVTLYGELKKRLLGEYNPLHQKLYRQGHSGGISFPFVKTNASEKPASLKEKDSYASCMYKADEAYHAKLFEAAEKWYTKAVDAANKPQPEYDAWIGVGNAQLKQEEFNAALTSFFKARDCDVENRDKAWRQVAIAQFWAGQHKAAVDNLCAIFDSNPQDIDLLYFIAKIIFEAGFPDKATCLYKYILDRRPDHELAEEIKQHLLKEGGMSVWGLLRLIEEYSPINKIFIDAAVENASSCADWICLSRFFVDQIKDVDQAETYLFLAEKGCVDSLAWISIASTWESLGNIEQSESSIQNALKLAVSWQEKFELAKMLRKECAGTKYVDELVSEALNQAETTSDCLIIGSHYEIYHDLQLVEQSRVAAEKRAVKYTDWAELIQFVTPSVDKYERYFLNAVATADSGWQCIKLLAPICGRKPVCGEVEEMILRDAIKKSFHARFIAHVLRHHKKISPDLRAYIEDKINVVKAGEVDEKDCCVMLRMKKEFRLTPVEIERFLKKAMAEAHEAQALVDLAYFFCNSHKINQAKIYLKRAEQASPEKYICWEDMATLWSEMGDKKEAERLWEERLHPNFWRQEI